MTSLDRLPWTTELPKEPGIYLYRIPGCSNVQAVGILDHAEGDHHKGDWEWCYIEPKLECCGCPMGCELLDSGGCPDDG